jgi:hypothetical protein
VSTATATRRGSSLRPRGEPERRTECCRLWPRQRDKLVKYGIEQLV